MVETQSGDTNQQLQQEVEQLRERLRAIQATIPSETRHVRELLRTLLQAEASEPGDGKAVARQVQVIADYIRHAHHPDRCITEVIVCCSEAKASVDAGARILALLGSRVVEYARERMFGRNRMVINNTLRGSLVLLAIARANIRLADRLEFWVDCCTHTPQHVTNETFLAVAGLLADLPGFVPSLGVLSRSDIDPRLRNLAEQQLKRFAREG